MTRDSRLISENYRRVLEAQAGVQDVAAAASKVAEKRIKDMSAFTTNLIAIDAFEDKTNDLFNTAIKTGFFTQQEATQAKQVIGATISAMLISLVVSTQVSSPNQLEQMKKAISDKIKGVDVSQVIQSIDSIAGGTASTAAPQPSVPQQPVPAQPQAQSVPQQTT